MNWRRYMAGACVLGSLSVAHATLEFSAFISIAGDYRFIITNTETRTNSGWLSLGETFEEHRLARFDAVDEILTLERDAGTIRLCLKHDPVEKNDAPKRRRLTDEGASKREIPIWVDGWGNLALGGTAVSLDEIEELFRKLVKVNADVVVVFLQAPPGPPETIERMRSKKNAVLGRAQGRD